MPNFIAYFGRDRVVDPKSFADERPPFADHEHHYSCGPHYQMLFGTRRRGESGIRAYEDEKWSCILAGDLPPTMELNWAAVFEAIECGSWARYPRLHAPHMLLCIDKHRSIAYVFSDPRSQYPVFLLKTPGSVCIANTILAFVRSGLANRINKNWLTEFVFFNYPVLSTSILESVVKISPATCVKICLETFSTESIEYSSLPRRRGDLYSGKDEVAYVNHVFKTVVEEYSSSGESVYLPLTAGLDSQSILACLGESSLPSVRAYTYGIENSNDLVSAQKTAERYGIAHQSVTFEPDFVKNLPNFMAETVYISGGSERILRSTLPYVYRTLQDGAPRRVLSGVSGDHIFRDHIRGRGNVPSIISAPFMNYIQGEALDQCLAQCPIPLSPDERDYLCDVVAKLNSRYGDVRRPEGYANFLVYECGPRYFAGEAAVASQFGPFNSIYWDNRIVGLLYEAENSTIGLSEKYPAKNLFREKYLQGNIMRRFAKKGKLTCRELPIHVFSSGNYPYYFASKIVLRSIPKIVRTVFPRQEAPLENWDLWVNRNMAPQGRRLLADSRIGVYYPRHVVERALDSDDFRLKSKLLNMELIMGLIENNWRLGGTW